MKFVLLFFVLLFAVTSGTLALAGDFSNFGDTATLLNPEIADKIKDNKV